MRVSALTVMFPVLWCATLCAEERIVKGLSVHEWGVFTAHDDADVANASIRSEWDELPEFVYGRIKGRLLPVNWGPLEFRKRPIIFFHSKDPVELRVRVGFPGGQPGVWWPGTSTPAAKGIVQPAATDFLEWRLGVGRPPAGFQPKGPAPEVAKGHWIEGVRAVKCGEIFAVYGEQGLDCERERFIYYDGIFPQGKWVKVNVDKDNVSLLNSAKHAVFDVTVVDRRVAGRVRVGRVARLEPAAEAKAVVMAAADPAGFAAEAAETLLKQLTAAGLNADEAGSLVDFRKTDFFATDGVQVFYRIPQEEYERLLPLTITPQPEKTVRVGLVLHPRCEPDFAARVLAVLGDLDAEAFAVREAATAKLAAMGPAAFVHLVRLRKTAVSPEVRSRIERVLEKYESQKAFPRE